MGDLAMSRMSGHHPLLATLQPAERTRADNREIVSTGRRLMVTLVATAIGSAATALLFLGQSDVETDCAAVEATAAMENVTTACAASCVGACWTKPWSPCLGECTLCENGSILLTAALVPYLGRLLIDMVMQSFLRKFDVNGWIVVVCTCVPATTYTILSENASQMRRCAGRLVSVPGLIFSRALQSYL